jgi:hypothetical protein
MGNQTPTYRERIRRNFHKQKEDIKELFYTGEIGKGIETIINFIAFSDPVYDIISTLAIAKASEIIQTKNLEELNKEIKSKSIHMTPASYITKEAIKYAEKTVKVALDSKNKILLENSLSGAIKARLEK